MIKDNYIILLFLVPILFGLLNALEFTSVLARYSGISINNHMMGYSLQQAVYIFTRFLVVLILPLMGLLTDLGVNSHNFLNMSRSSLFLSFIFGVIILFLSRSIISYYIRVINKYKVSSSFLKAMISSIFSKNDLEIDEQPIHDFIKNIRHPEIIKSLALTTIIFGIYGSGMFISFYFSLMIPEYRTSLSQMSGAINAFGAVMLTFFVEPHISKRIDEHAAIAKNLIMSIFVGRLLGLLILGQILLAMLELFE